MNPLISYYGGKQRIASKVVEQISKIPHTVYAEIFAGGLAVLYEKGKPSYMSKASYREYINDTSELLINLYRVARSCKEEFYDLIQWTPYSQSEHKKAVTICKHPELYSDIEKAWAYYVSIQMSFAKQLNNGWGTSVFSQNQAATWQIKKKTLLEKVDRLSEVHISCEDALKCLQRVDSPHTLIYADPPYVGTNLGHYGGFTSDDYQALCNALDNCQSSYILSNYPQSIYPRSSQKVVEIEASMSASDKGKVKRSSKGEFIKKEEMGDKSRIEVLWICDRSDTIRKDLSFCRVDQLSLI